MEHDTGRDSGRDKEDGFVDKGGIGMSQQKKEVLLTEEGLAKVKEELEYLRTKKRHEVAQRLKEAIAQGDLSENSEYDSAKEEQAFVESRIVQLENMIRNAKIINQDAQNKNYVSIGAKVTIQELPDGEKETYVIVGSAESDPTAGKISNESPIGAELIGKREGEIINVPVPSGTIQFKILEIN
jgi:transcription elongation factor GreA